MAIDIAEADVSGWADVMRRRLMEEISNDACQSYDRKHPEVLGDLIDAFEKRGGGCGHDLGYGAFAIIEAWEKIRSDERVADLQLFGEK